MLAPPDPTRHLAILFDCDGTLADTMGAHYLAWSGVATRYGLDFPRERFFSLAGVPTHTIVQMLLEEVGSDADVDEVCALREALYAEIGATVRPVPPVLDLARRWRSLRFAVVSGSRRAAVDHTLEALDLNDWFEVRVCAEDVVRGKPAPDAFLLAAQRLGVSPEQCIVYEDADLGLEAARAAGMEAVDVRPHFDPWWPGE